MCVCVCASSQAELVPSQGTDSLIGRSQNVTGLFPNFTISLLLDLIHIIAITKMSHFPFFPLELGYLQHCCQAVFDLSPPSGCNVVCVCVFF